MVDRKVSDVKRPLTYLVTLLDQRIVHRHVDHIRSRTSQATDLNSNNDVDIPTFMDTTPLTSEEDQMGPTQVSCLSPIHPKLCSSQMLPTFNPKGEECSDCKNLLATYRVH